MDIPCAALKGEYTTKKALSKLISERKAEIDGKFMVIEYDNDLTNSQFVKAVTDKYSNTHKREDFYGE